MKKNGNVLTAGKPDRKRRKLKTEHLKEFLCVVPAILFVILTNYYPLGNLIRISFTDWNLVRRDWNFVGLKNWVWFLQNASGNYFYKSLWITIKYTVISTSLQIVLGLALAMLMNRMTRGFSVMRAIIFLPRYVAMSTGGIVFLWILNNQYGILNLVIQKLGGTPLPWLTDRSLALVSILLLTTWHSVGYAMMIYLANMAGISREYYEVASLDGATRWQQFRYITIPLLSPTTLFLVVTHFIGSMKIYNSVDVLTMGGPYRSTEVIVYLIYRLAFDDFRVDRAAVVSLVFFLILLVITLTTMRWSENKVSYDQ